MGRGGSFLLPVRALSKIIRAKFLDALEKVFREERLKGTRPCLTDPAHFQRFTRKLKRKKWVVYAKGTFDASQNAYHYLSRYTHRVAIANHRLLDTDQGRLAHPTPDHYLPLLYSFGASDTADRVRFPVTGFDMGSLSMRSVLFG